MLLSLGGCLCFGRSQTPERIQKVDHSYGSTKYSIEVVESSIGGSTFWILPGVWVAVQELLARAEALRAALLSSRGRALLDALGDAWGGRGQGRQSTTCKHF